MEFTKQQKLAIAEFVFAFFNDTLIKSEADNLIKVFQEHHVPEAFVANLETEDCIKLVMDNTTPSIVQKIMKEYFSGKL